MQRESDKQSRAHDEHLRKETNDLTKGSGAVRAEEAGPAREEAPARRDEGPGRRDEGPGRREEGPARRDEPANRPEPPVRAMSPAEVARRAELTRHLPPNLFPADRRRLLAHLRSKKAPASVVDAVSALPEGQQFRTIGDVLRAAGSRAGR